MTNAAQLVIAILLVVLAVVAINDGPAGLKNWWRAKFLGRTPHDS